MNPQGPVRTRSDAAHRGVARALVVALVAAATLSSCWSLQRSPGPMPFAGEDESPTLREPVARLIRHGDMVQYRPAGEAGTVTMAFHRKEAELAAGSWVFTGSSGRAEFLRPTGSSAILFGTGAASLGDGRQAPWLNFTDFDRVRMLLRPGDRVGLPGGAELEPIGTGDEPGGPFVLEKTDRRLFRVHNQGTVQLRVRYRDETLVLEPAQRVVLARIADGYGGTDALGAQTSTLALGERSARVVGRVDATPEEGGRWRLAARGGPATVFVQGLRLELADGEEVVWRFPEGPPAD